MIRNVVMGRVRADLDDTERAQLQRGLDGIAGLQLPGLRSMSVGHDAGLRDGGWSFAIVNDWDDEAAYRHYDLDAEHNEYRAMVGGLCVDIGRVQFETS